MRFKDFVVGLSWLLFIPTVHGQKGLDSRGDFHDESKPQCSFPSYQQGFDFRVRLEYCDNSKLDSSANDHEIVRQRYRLRYWNQYRWQENLSLNSRWVTEPWYFNQPDNMDHPLQWNELLLDQLNIQWNFDLYVPVALTAGRQDIRLGDGWLVRRGTPLDSSRTNFFDAVRTTFAGNGSPSTVDLIYINNHSDTAAWLKPVNDQDVDLSEQDSEGVIAYFADARLEQKTVDYYFIYKHDDKVLRNGNDAEIYTISCRLSGRINDRWSYGCEAAPQFGRKNDTAIHGLGGISKLNYHLHDAWDGQWHMGYEYRSGDTKKDGCFDMLWGRYGENWADLNGSLGGLENQTHHMTNLHRIECGWQGCPTEKLALNVAYHLLLCDRNPLGGTSGFSEDGRLRGHMITQSISYVFSKHCTGSMHWELFFPGSYYTSPRDDPAAYLRLQMMFTW